MALASVATVAGRPAPGIGLESSEFSFGPASCEVTSHSALVWLRARRPSRLRVEYGLDPGLGNASATPPKAATSATDYTLVFNLGGLHPGREYFYRGVLLPSGATGEPVRGPIGRFQTAPESAQEFRFAWSGDMEASHQPFTIFAGVLEKDPHFFILLGDTMYADKPKWRADLTLNGYRRKHRENRGDPHLQRLLARTAVFAMWDDHEVENDFDRTNPRIPEGRQAFREYWPVRTESADPGVLYRRFSWGSGADFFVLDCRQYRSPKGEPDGPEKTMLGKVQKEWFKESIRASRAPFKFIISSVPFLGSWGADKWSGYATEREELFRFFRAENVSGIIILSADLHLAMDQAGPNRLREFVAGPIATSTFCRPGLEIPPRLQRSGRFVLCDAFNYGLVTVRPQTSPPEAEVQILDGTNTVRYRVRVESL